MNYKGFRYIATGLFIVILLVIASIFFLNGGFIGTSINHLTINATDYTYYLGYEMTWDGIVKPVIRDVYLTNAQGKILIMPENQSLDKLVFIDPSNNIGSIAAAEINEDNLVSYRNYNMKTKKINLVIKVDAADEKLKEAEGIIIDYSILGVRKSTMIDIKFPNK